MSWYLHTTRIFVQEKNASEEQIIARIQPLGNESIYHVFGHISPSYTLNCKVVGDADKEALMNLCAYGLQYTLSGPEKVWEDVLVKKVDAKRANCYWQTLRQDLDEHSPVYDVSVELWQSY